jgi:hypothetical protein
MGSFIYRLFPAKRQESWMHVILFLCGFDSGFDHKETTETNNE